MSDFYHDDPVEEVSGTRRNFKGIISLILIIAVGGTYLQTTLAANIRLNSGIVVNFGQGVTTTAACSGGTSLTITPISSFVNVSGGGAFYFTSVKVANIPTSCIGKDFVINAYSNSSNSPLAIFNTSSTNAVVYDNAGTFELGDGTTVGASITSGSGTFTLTFTNPVATATSVFKLTIQSSNHAVTGFDYNVGDIGPGGGRIFYKSVTGFNCGANYTSTGSPSGKKCYFLEAAPSSWSGLDELDQDDNVVGPEKDSPFIYAVTAQELQNISDNAYDLSGTLVSQVGRGYKNSLAILGQAGNDATTAAGAARAYRGGSKSDWYLPTFSESILLCQWAKGITQDATQLCNSSVAPTQTGNGFEVMWDADPSVSSRYWTSSENPADQYGPRWPWTINMSDGSGDSPSPKGSPLRVRPIRAF